MSRALALASLLLLLPLGCKSDEPRRDLGAPDRPAVIDVPLGTTAALIGPAGGTASSLDGQLKLEIPSGAVSKTVTITVASAKGVPADVVAYDIGPTGLVFDKPVTLRIGYNPASYSGVPETSLRLGTLVAGAWQVVVGSTVDTVKHEVSGEITHLSIWGVVRLSTPDGSIDKTAPIDVRSTDLPRPSSSGFSEVWHENTGTPCSPPKMVLVPKPAAVEVQLTAIPMSFPVQGSCGGHAANITATGPTTLEITISGDTGSACNTACWDFTFTITTLPPGAYTVKFGALSDTVTVTAASGG